MARRLKSPPKVLESKLPNNYTTGYISRVYGKSRRRDCVSAVTQCRIVRSITEQEAVATWPIRQDQLMGKGSLAWSWWDSPEDVSRLGIIKVLSSLLTLDRESK